MIRNLVMRLLRNRLFAVGIVLVLFFVRSFVTLDPDFGWHLRSGEYFMAHGIPKTDIYTYTAASFPWVDHEWLNDIVVAVTYHAGGYILLAVVFAVLWTLALWLIGRKVYPVLFVLAALGTLPLSGIRTVTWSVLFLAILVVVMRSRMRYWLALIPLFMLWANLHGSFVVGLLYIGYEAVRRRSWRIGVLGLAATAVTFINPYGGGVYVEVWRTLSDSGLRWQISEWRAAAIPVIGLPILLLWAGTFAAVDGRRRRAYVGADVIGLLASLSSVRNFPLFIVLSLESLDRRCRTLLKKIPKNLDLPRRRFLIGMATGAVVIIAATAYVSFHDTTIDRNSAYPAAAVAELTKKPCSGNLFNDYAYGGYLIWKLPDQKVYIDGRMPSWSMNGVKYLDIYRQVQTDRSVQRREFAKYNITCALVGGPEAMMIKDLKQDGWSAVDYPDGSTLLRKD